MPKRTTNRRASQPLVPTVALRTWRDLVAAADSFGSLAPWTWVHDSDLLGLRHPVTGEPLLCSVLGRLRHVFALLVYRGNSGRRWVLNTILEDEDSGGLEDAETAFEQDCVKVEFVNKRDLTKEDRAVLEAAGFSPGKKAGRAWPVFRSLVPGGYPWYVSQAEADLLLYALPRVAAFGVLLRDTPGLVVDLSGKGVPFPAAGFDPALRALRPEDLDWQPQIPPPASQPAPATLTDTAVTELVALPQAQGFHLELDMFYAPMPLSGRERPWFPKAVMAVDRASGFVGAFRLAEAGDAEGANALAHALTATLRQFGHRPAALHVQRSRLALMLTPIAARLGVPIYHEAELATLNAARQEITRRMSG